MSRKNLFDIDMDNDKGTIDSEQFISRKLSKETMAKRSALVSEYYKASSKNLAGCVRNQALGAFAVIVAVGLGLLAINYYLELFSSKFIELIWGVLVLFMFIFSRSIKKRSSKPLKPSKKMIEIDNQLGELNKLIEKELGVSDYAKDIDLILNIYGEGEEDDRINDKAKLFEEGDNLSIYYDGVVVSVKKNSFEEIVKIDEEIYLDEWHKDTPFDRGRYMQYKIEKIDKRSEGIYKEYKMQGYYSVRFSQDDNGYEILVPLYDIEPFADALRLSPKERY